MRNILIIGGILTVGLLSQKTAHPPAIEEPRVVDHHSVTVETPPVIVGVEVAPVETNDPVQSTNYTAAKAEVQSLTWQIEIMREQLEKAQAEVDTTASMETELEPPPDIVEPTTVYRAAPRGHYEYRRQGLFRRNKVWISE